MRNLFAAACAALIAAFAGAGAAEAQQTQAWRVSATSGVVRVTEPGQHAAQARVDAPLSAGTTVTTGANSRATLENGQQRIVMTANSRMTIAADSNNTMTRILQDMGSLLFQVDRREQQHFRVETPLLAAVVKGTTFTVTASGAQDMVHVTQGLVEVRAAQGGAAMDLPSGASAQVNRDTPTLLSAVEPGAQAASAAAETPALDYQAASNGIVENPGANAPAFAETGRNNSGERSLSQRAGEVLRGVVDMLTGGDNGASNQGVAVAALSEASVLGAGNGNAANPGAVAGAGGGAGNGNAVDPGAVAGAGGGAGNGNAVNPGAVAGAGGAGNGNGVDPGAVAGAGGGAGNGNGGVVPDPVVPGGPVLPPRPGKP